MKRFEVGADATRIAVLVFSEEINLVFGLDRYACIILRGLECSNFVPYEMLVKLYSIFFPQVQCGKGYD